MIRVTIELIPFGVGEPRTLGIAEITNDGTGDKNRGNYNFTLSKWAPKTHEVWKTGHVVDFDRKGRGPWDLLYLVLRSCVRKRNKEASSE